MTSPGPIIPGLAFYDALVNNDLNGLKRLVDSHKIDINASFSHVRKRKHTDLCPIHLVAYIGNLPMLHYLIQNGANVHKPTCILLRRPVHYAALRQQVSCLKMLLNAGAEVDPRDVFDNTPLHYAAEDGNGGLLSLLLNNGACVDAQDIINKTPLMKAARSGRVWLVRRLILFGANVNVRDRNDETALHFACRQGSTEITRMLIKAKARLNAQNQLGLTPLMDAVCYNQREVVSLLIKQPDIDLYKRVYCTGDTALHLAVKKNYIHIVEILLRAGNWYIEYNYNNHGESFVHDVIAYNRLELLRLFLAYNYDFDRPAKRITSANNSASLLDFTIGLSPNRIQEPSSASSSSQNEPQPSTSSVLVPTSSQKFGPQANSLIYEKSPFQMALERGHLDMARILADVGCFSTGVPIGANSTTSTINSDGTSAPSSSSNRQIYYPLAKRYAGLVEVKSLQKWCRKVIRQRLGFRLMEALPKLPIPVSLKNFLLLSDLDWSIHLHSAFFNSRSGSNKPGELAIIVPP